MLHTLLRLFVTLLGLSLEASLIAAVVIVLRLVFRCAPKWTHCLMWSLVAVRLLCPYTPQSNLSVMPSQNPIQRSVSYSTAATSNPGSQAAPSAFQEQDASAPTAAPSGTVRQSALAPSDETPAANVPSAQPLLNQKQLTAAAGVWLVGLFTVAVYTALSYLGLRRKVSEAVRLKENIYLTDRVSSAFLFGLIRPKIYLPFGMSAENTAQIIAHEQAHLRRRDHLTKSLAFALAAVYWFNPILWLSYALYCRDIELACDENVIRNKTTAQRKAYSRALLECSSNASAFSLHNQIPVGFGKTAVKRRVINVLKNKKPAIWLICGALAATAIVAVVMLTRPKTYTADIPDSLNQAVTEAILEQNNAVYTEVTPSDLSNNSIDGRIAEHARNYFGAGFATTDVECIGEGHIILGTNRSNNTVEVYALCSAIGYGFRDSYFVDNAGYSQVPTLFTFTVDDSDPSEYVCTLDSVKEAEDGGLFKASVYDMFPKSVADKLFKENHEDYSDELLAQCNRCAEAYLKKIGRDAKVSSYHDCGFKILSDYGVSVEVSNALSELHAKYDIYVGNFETIEHGTRYIYSQIWSPDAKVYGNGTVTFLKCEYDTGKEIEKFVYKVDGDSFVQVK